MAIISFWSDTRKETAQTLSMIALASYLAVENNSKILIVDTNVNDKTITDAFWPQQESSTRKLVNKLSEGKIDLGSGIEGLAKLITSGKTDPEVIPDYARVVFKGRLEAVLSFMTDHPEEASRIDSTYVELIKIANQKYDYVFVDVRKGMSDPLTNQILEISNTSKTNIMVISQNDSFYFLKQKNKNTILEKYGYYKVKKYRGNNRGGKNFYNNNYQNKQRYPQQYAMPPYAQSPYYNNPYFQKNKVLPLIGRYDRYSKYNKKNIARYIGEKKDISAVSYNTLFFESANEGGMGDYFLKFRKSLISSSDRNASFVEEVANAADRLVLKVQEVQMMR